MCNEYISQKWNDNSQWYNMLLSEVKIAFIIARKERM